MRKDQIIKAARIVREGGIVAFATETVMGLGIEFDNLDAFEHLNKVKQRPALKPYSLMLGNVRDIEKYAILNDKARILINKFLPGSLTFLLKVNDNVPGWVTLGTGVIGIRVPSNDTALALLKEVGKPMLVPSANKSGESPALNSDEAKKIFGDEVDYVISGKSLGAAPSTIVDMTNEDNIIIVREGPITKSMIDRALGGK